MALKSAYKVNRKNLKREIENPVISLRGVQPAIRTVFKTQVFIKQAKNKFIVSNDLSFNHSQFLMSTIFTVGSGPSTLQAFRFDRSEDRFQYSTYAPVLKLNESL